MRAATALRPLLVLALASQALACGGSVSTPPSEPVDSGNGETSTDGGGDGSPGDGTPGDAPTDAPTDTSGVTADQACTDVAAAICGRLDSCTTALIAISYGDVAKCKERVKLGCLAGLTAPGTTGTPSRYEACSKDLTASACLDLYSKKPLPACIPDPGPTANGGPCGEDGQCSSTFCARTPGAGGCGVCAPMPKEGDACVNKQCGRALDCNASDKCFKIRLLGETCDADATCAASLSCFGGKCVAAAKAGEACDAKAVAAPTCDQSKGLFCNPFAKVCQAVAFAKAGDPCGVVPPDFKVCTAAAFCRTSGGTSGVCVAPAADGAACNPKDGPECMAPANCVGGVCKLPDPTGCK